MGISLEYFEGIGMLMIFVASSALAYALLRKKRDIELKTRSLRDRNFNYFLIDNSINFLLPLIIVLSFYFMLSAAVSAGLKLLDIGTLIQIEETFAGIKSRFAFFKLSAGQAFIGLIIIYFLGLFGLNAGRSRSLSRGYKTYRGITRQIYVILVLLCSFTFFGSQFGDPTEDIRLRFKTIRDGYADLREIVHQELSEQLAEEIYDKAMDEFPPSYSAALGMSVDFNQRLIYLNTFYVAIQKEYEVKSPKVELILAGYKNQIQSAPDIKTEIQIDDVSVRQKAIDLTTLSDRKIANMEKALDSYRADAGTKGVVFLKLEGGKELVVHIPKLITSQVKKALFQEWLDAYPILGPVVDVFVRSIDKELENEIGEAVDRITSTAIQDGTDTNELIRKEATKIVDGKTVEIPQSILDEAIEHVQKLEADGQEVQAVLIELEDEVVMLEAGKINRLIAKLKSQNEQEVISAAQKLSGMGEKMERGQVEEIVQLMRVGKEKWRVFLRRSGHCTYYEFTTTTSHVADLLLNIESEYVNGAIRSEARVAKEKGCGTEKVMDPGWI